ncbi:unnamed protein product [Agarophyton chilense]
MKSKLQAAIHGKARVRVAKVTRTAGRHDFTEFTVQIELSGGTNASFTEGDNRFVVATDTCKNHVYVLAKTHPMSCPETFALSLANRFLQFYSHLDGVRISVEERPWRRYQVDAVPHAHGFVLSADGTSVCDVQMTRTETILQSGLKSLSVLKTTQSGWEKFLRDNFTTLPDTTERILATTIDAKWSYRIDQLTALLRIDYPKLRKHVLRLSLQQFFGPLQTGVYSKGVQETLFKMANAVVQQVKELDTITFSLPNLHFLPCNIPVFEKNGIPFQDDIFIPSSEPHGLITATVSSRNIPTSSPIRRSRL